MAEAVSSVCADHPDRFDCPDALIHYSPHSRSFGIIVHDGGSSSVRFTAWPPDEEEGLSYD
jgi:hypothetical protein